MNLNEESEEEIPLEPLLATLVEFLLRDNLPLAAGVIASSKVSWEYCRHDQWENREYFGLVFAIPVSVFTHIQEGVYDIQSQILSRIQTITRACRKEGIETVTIVPQMQADPQWREKTFAYIAGQGITNQGRVRSDNIAPFSNRGLLFRSQAEINLFEALQGMGISFAPLPVFVRGGQEYRRIEPDFVVLKDGRTLVIEVDGDTFHKETPAEAQDRTEMLENEGAIVFHVPANECDTYQKAVVTAKRILDRLAKIKAAGR